jgi:ATP-dependent exoDNAse (exonuclease V) beta subunit
VRGRPVGKAFGTLVHEALASADLDAEAEALKSLTRTLGRLLGNTEEEIEAAAQAVRRALKHPLLKRAKSASRLGLCHREIPFVYRQPDGGLLEGAADLVFRDEPGSPWMVVDFKTDARLDIGQDTYRRQVALYMQALRQSTGADAKGILLYV